MKSTGDVAADRAALAGEFAAWAARNRALLLVALARGPRSLQREFTYFLESWERLHG